MTPSFDSVAWTESVCDGQNAVADWLKDRSAPRLLVFTACHALQWSHYLHRHTPERWRRWNILFMMAQALEVTGQHDKPWVKHAFESADALIAHRHRGPLIGRAVFEQFLKPDVQEVIVPTMYCSAMVPMCQHFGEEGVLKLLKEGRSEDEIWKRFTSGTFDPCFTQRWAKEMARLSKEDDACAVRIAPFVRFQWQHTKLWWTPMHPTFFLASYVIEQAMRILEKAPPLNEGWNPGIGLNEVDFMSSACPETEYEWRHYGFRYPRTRVDPIEQYAYFRKELRNIISRHENT